MKQIILGTNIILRFLLKDVPKQTIKVRNKFKEAKTGSLKIIVPQIVVFEVAFALASFYHFDKEKVIEGLETIMATHYLFIDDRECFAEALKTYKDKNVSLVDSFLCSKSQLDKIELFTFDEKLLKLVDQ